MTITIIGPKEFELLFYFVIFVIGVDYFSSGFIITKTQSLDIKRRRLLGLWISKKLVTSHNKKSNKLTSFMNFFYRIKNMGILLLICGILIAFGSGAMITEILFSY